MDHIESTKELSCAKKKKNNKPTIRILQLYKVFLAPFVYLSGRGMGGQVRGVVTPIVM